MVYTLLIGDAHIPRRAPEVSPYILDKLTQLTSKTLFDYTFFTGDLVKAQDFIQFLNIRTKNDVFTVIGNMDYYEGNKESPLYRQLSIPLKDGTNLIIGLTHGHQISPRGDFTQLELLALEREYNILISGHTHKEEIHITDNGILLLNPGSVTGAWSFIASRIPSFITLVIKTEDNSLIATLYQLNAKTYDIREITSHFIFKNLKISHKY
jgi:putative phosphoesterase